MPFLGRETKVDAADAAFGDVDGDEVEDVADCDELVIIRNVLVWL